MGPLLFATALLLFGCARKSDLDETLVWMDNTYNPHEKISGAYGHGRVACTLHHADARPASDFDRHRYSRSGLFCARSRYSGNQFLAAVLGDQDTVSDLHHRSLLQCLLQR